MVNNICHKGKINKDAIILHWPASFSHKYFLSDHTNHNMPQLLFSRKIICEEKSTIKTTLNYGLQVLTLTMHTKQDSTKNCPPKLMPLEQQQPRDLADNRPAHFSHVTLLL